jgi:hypothetical protein
LVAVVPAAAHQRRELQDRWAELRHHLGNHADDLAELSDSNNSNQTIAIRCSFVMT